VTMDSIGSCVRRQRQCGTRSSRDVLRWSVSSAMPSSTFPKLSALSGEESRSSTCSDTWVAGGGAASWLASSRSQEASCASLKARAEAMRACLSSSVVGEPAAARMR